MEEKAKQYGIGCHVATNHLYDNQPYALHLTMVREVAGRFIHLVPELQQETVFAACWVHDVIEDCRQTYNDVKNATDKNIAEIAYALTNEKGKNRSQRANKKYYEGILTTPGAVFVKLCDRIANFEYSVGAGSRMAEMYRKENQSFLIHLSDMRYIEMLEYLKSL